MTTLAFSAAAHELTGPAPTAAPALPHDGAHDFDFLHGSWIVRNRRLRDPLTGSSEWYEFDGRSDIRPLWDGQGNIDEYDATLPDGTRLRGLTLRLYEPRAKRWTIRWSNSATGTLDLPMTGTFENGRGEFYSQEDFRGRMILVRFVWTSDGRDAARWEQSFSADGGRTWESNWIMDFERVHDARCDVVELRQYTLHPGQRETLIELFDREFVDTQEATGMTVIAQFRDIDRPDVFTWLRGFPDMRTRAASLHGFYDGPSWAAHRNAANATMISSDNVRLLRPAGAGSGFAFVAERAAVGAAAIPPGLLVATIYTLRESAVAVFAEEFTRTAIPRLIASGARPCATFETESSANTFPRLPVREGEHAFVWFSVFDDVAAYDRHVAMSATDPVWVNDVCPALERQFVAQPEIWRLTPTARSRPLRG